MKNQLFHIGVKGIIRNTEGKFLCVKSRKGYFDIPGGRIMEGEDWQFAIRREIREELCIPSDAYNMSNEILSLPTERFTEQEPEKIQLFILLCMCELGKNVEILLNEENTEYTWETARDLYKKVDILWSIPFETIFK